MPPSSKKILTLLSLWKFSYILSASETIIKKSEAIENKEEVCEGVKILTL